MREYGLTKPRKSTLIFTKKEVIKEAVFRIERNRDYTVMSNHHLRDTGLSLKSKGLLSMMLSLPEEWNYTTRGLAAICKEGADCMARPFGNWSRRVILSAVGFGTARAKS